MRRRLEEIAWTLALTSLVFYALVKYAESIQEPEGEPMEHPEGIDPRIEQSYQP